MRVISLIPSLTETLLASNIDVVGRTRFCIHPEDKIAAIPVIGGTKEVNWDLAPRDTDLVIFDKEENSLAMAESCPFPKLVLHIFDFQSLARSLLELSKIFNNLSLQEMSEFWQKQSEVRSPLFFSLEDWLEWRGISVPSNISDRKVFYLIWDNPLMAIGRNTFISAMLKRIFPSEYLYLYEDKYPQIELSSLDIEKCVFLASSEPYPFHKFKNRISGLVDFVDGESFSWYGIRAQKFLTLLENRVRN